MGIPRPAGSSAGGDRALASDDEPGRLTGVLAARSAAGPRGILPPAILTLAGCGFVLLAGACGTPASESAVGAAASGATPAAASSSSGATAPASTVAPSAPPSVSGPPRENGYLKLQVTEAGFWPTDRAAPPGLRYYTVGLRGTSKSDSADAVFAQMKGNDVILDVRRFVFGQNEQGCIFRPEREVAGVERLIGDSITFPPTGHGEARLVFLVPEETVHVRVVIAPAGEGLVVPAGPDFAPGWPAPLHTIDDGATLRVHVLRRPSPPASVPPAASGREHVVIDVAVENRTEAQGVEFQTSQQLRLVDAAGRFVQPSAPLTKLLSCRLDDGDVIPPGHTRRLQVVYDMPAGAPRRLQYRGFERDEATVAIP